MASLAPGRLRIKLHPTSRDPQMMHGIKRSLESHEGIHGVTVNPASGSVTVKYDHGYHSTAGILGLLEDLDVVVESIGHMPTLEDHEIEGGDRLETEGFLAAVDDLNQRIYEATGIPINLKMALPLAFVGAGLWSIGKKGLMIESVPGWLFLWLAFDMFVKLHPPDR
jgi:copper chaperone CopZ